MWIVNLGLEEKIMATCSTCKHLGLCGHEGYAYCNKDLKEKGLVFVKQDQPACDQYCYDWDGTLWKDSFGYEYRYDWQTNGFVCEQTGKTLGFEYRKRLIQE